jgi:hypothetical protein
MAGELVVSTINGAGFDAANVIINPEFTINQRGAASRTAATGYNFDRWYYDGTDLLQGVEGNNLRAGTYVLSWSGSSTAEFSLNTAAASGQGSESYTAVTNGGTITIASVGSNNLWVRFSSDLTNLTRVKLSPGTEASGFVARPYGTELALCQRYFEVLGYGCIAMAESGSTYVMNLPYRVTKRTAPSLGLTITANLRVRQFGVSDRDAASPNVVTSAGSNTGGNLKISGFSSIGSASTPAGIGYTTTSEDGNAFFASAEL